MSEQLTETPAPVETPATSAPSVSEPEAPRSPSEAVNLVDHYSRQAQEITGEAEPQHFDDLALSDDPFADDADADWNAPIEQPRYTDPEPGDPDYPLWAEMELDRLRAEQVRMIAEAGLQLGVDPTELAQAVGTARGQREAAAHQYMANAENFALEHIEGLGEEWGAEYVDPAETLSIARQAHAEVARRYGPEVADGLVQEIYAGAVHGAAAQFEGVANYGVQLAKQHAAHLGTAAPDPVEILRHAEEVFPRQLREHGGDQDAALEAAFAVGVSKAGGKPTSARQVTELYSRRARRIEDSQRVRAAAAPPAPQPPPRSTKQIVDHYAAEARRLAKETR